MILALLAAAATQAPAIRESFDEAAAWKAAASDGVTARASTRDGALRLDYDFANVSGYAFVSRERAIDWPANYRLTLKIRGTGGANDLQIKFTDAAGTNVWWARRNNFRPSPEWQTITLAPRDLEFAWGPATDKTLRRTARIELVVARGRDGGAGAIELDDLILQPLPTASPLPAPRASDASLIDGDRTAAVRGTDHRIDFGGEKELGGLVLHWRAPPGRYTIAGSRDGRSFTTLRDVEGSDGGSDPIRLPETTARIVAIRTAPGAQLAEVEVKSREWGATPNAMIAELAKEAPRGTYPRGFTEQSYWTLLGSDGGHHSGLIGEDGAIEVAKGGFSIEPFVVVDGRARSWADAKISHAMARNAAGGALPLPAAAWSLDGLALTATGFADVSGERLWAHWRLENRGPAPRTVALALAVRPFQVNPPAQFLSQRGGVSAIDRIGWDGTSLTVRTPPAVDGDAPVTRTVRPALAPTRVTLAPFDRGAAAPALPSSVTPDLIRGPAYSRSNRIEDPAQLATATLLYERTLAPAEAIDVPVAIPFAEAAAATDYAAARAAYLAKWSATLGQVAITVPAAKQPVADTVRTALAHVLMSRDGPALKPGTRSYDRSWIRDGAMMGDTLLRLGLPQPVRAFADWYGTKLFANGKVPCCVDFRGADPVPENDSHGEYIHLVTQLYRFTGDRAALARDWPRLDAARRYMEGLRQSQLTPANRTEQGGVRYGLMPPSISHEGYSAQAQYSLWDDFWALTGYTDAAFAARALDKPEATTITQQRDAFARDIHNAIKASQAKFGIDFIPGATSLGDFDATSTTIALDPAGQQRALDQQALAATFDRQVARVTGRATATDWQDYTPYELRNVSALTRLSRRAEANRLLDIYMADRRPAEWNQWAEVVGRLPREIRFIGDMPHAWVASDFIRAALDLFAYEDEDRIVVAGGLDASWLSGTGSAIRGLRTSHGRLDVSAKGDGERVSVTIAGDARPAGGFVVAWPYDGVPGNVTVNGRRAKLASDGVHIPASDHSIIVEMTR